MTKWLVLSTDRANVQEALNLDMVDRIELRYNLLDDHKLAQVTLYIRGREPLRMYDSDQMQAVQDYVGANRIKGQEQKAAPVQEEMPAPMPTPTPAPGPAPAQVAAKPRQPRKRKTDEGGAPAQA